jgi:hypothetical protein
MTKKDRCPLYAAFFIFLASAAPTRGFPPLRTHRAGPPRQFKTQLGNFSQRLGQFLFLLGQIDLPDWSRLFSTAVPGSELEFAP